MYKPEAKRPVGRQEKEAQEEGQGVQKYLAFGEKVGWTTAKDNTCIAEINSD